MLRDGSNVQWWVARLCLCCQLQVECLVLINVGMWHAQWNWQPKHQLSWSATQNCCCKGHLVLALEFWHRIYRSILIYFVLGLSVYVFFFGLSAPFFFHNSLHIHANSEIIYFFLELWLWFFIWIPIVCLQLSFTTTFFENVPQLYFQLQSMYTFLTLSCNL